MQRFRLAADYPPWISQSPEIALLALVGIIAGLLPSTIAERRGIRLAADIGAGVAGVFVAAWLVASWRDLVPFSLTTPAGKPPEKVSVDINIPNYTPVVLPLAPLKPLLKPVVFRSREEICDTLVHAALSNDLPVPFFIRLLYQESTFRPAAISSAGALGIAQFMPETAAHRRLDNPFDPAQAIPASAKLLRDHYRRFGNLGLAAAAYNAGPRRVDDWRAKKGPMPQETQDYVKVITGFPVESLDHAARRRSGVEGSAGRAVPGVRRPARLGRARRNPDAGVEPARGGGEGRGGRGARSREGEEGRQSSRHEKAGNETGNETGRESERREKAGNESAGRERRGREKQKTKPDVKEPDKKEPSKNGQGTKDNGAASGPRALKRLTSRASKGLLFHVHRRDLLVSERQQLSVGARSFDISFVTGEIGAQQDARARRRADGNERMMRLRLGEGVLQQLPLAEIHCPITANCVLSSRQDGCLSALRPKADMCSCNSRCPLSAKSGRRSSPSARLICSLGG